MISIFFFTVKTNYKMLKQDWVDKNKKFAFSGVTKIFNGYNKNKSIHEIENELASIPVYSRHKEGKRVRNYNPFFVYKRNEMWQADIMYLPETKNKTCKKYKYLLCVLDVFSRKLFIRLLQKKDQSSVIKNFDSIHQEITNSPEKIVVDKGTEFTSETFQKYCEFFGIKLIFTYNETKAAHVERAQRSFQNILYRILEHHQSDDFCKYLDDTLDIYNNRENRITGYSPNFAYKSKNHKLVLSNLEKKYRKSLDLKKNPKFKKGDHVRIKEIRSKFARGYHPYFSEEIFKIQKVLTNLPQVRYILTDFSGGEEIKGSFYESEITLCEISSFKVEKILQKRGKGKNLQYYVKWKGYPESQNSWINASWIKKIK